jgi:hypothetical protein
VRFEVGFIAGYAALLLLAALGLRRLGAANTSAWASRLLAAHRRHAPDATDTTAAHWPHTDASRLYTAVAAVAAAAALLLTGAEIIRHHRPPEIALLAATGLVAAYLLARLTGALRAAGPAAARRPPP